MTPGSICSSPAAVRSPRSRLSPSTWGRDSPSGPRADPFAIGQDATSFAVHPSAEPQGIHVGPCGHGRSPAVRPLRLSAAGWSGRKMRSSARAPHDGGFMRTILRSIAVLAVLACSPLTASAQLGLAHHFVTVGIGGGMSVPVSDASDAFKNGYNVQGFARLNVPKLPVMPRFDLDFSRFDLNDAQVGVPGTGQILAGLANLQLSVLP